MVCVIQGSGVRGICRCVGMIIGLGLMAVAQPQAARAADPLRDFQAAAILAGKSEVAHWGVDPSNYVLWGTHSNRLIPVYTFGTLGAGPGIDLTSYTGENSPYRQEGKLRRIYGYLPTHSVSPTAEYLDQTNIYDLQLAGVAAGKKHIFLVIFDGMDWNTTQAAAIYNTKSVAYREGRGRGTHFQEYTAAGTTQYGYMVTSPHNEGTEVDVDTQSVKNVGGTILGGYDSTRGGPNPWTPAPDLPYLISLPTDAPVRHAYTDSSSSAVSMTAGIKTYNNVVNRDAAGNKVPTIAHRLQQEGYAVGVVTSVPISHATPAAAYSHNVDRDDYQDLSRDLLGLPSISHPEKPLLGMDVVIGAGAGVSLKIDKGQGKNFVPGNRYLTRIMEQAIDVSHGGPYIVARRTAGVVGSERLRQAAEEAAATGKRLFGFYGAGDGHGNFSGNLPMQTADGDYQPAPGRTKEATVYSPEDLKENPTLAQMTTAALTVLAKRNEKGFWLMMEAGDVDWANHDNNLDTSIGAVNSGDAAVRVITDWVEKNSNWKDSLLIVTADHGHYLVLEKPEMLAATAATAVAEKGGK